MLLERRIVGRMQNFSYLLGDPETHEAAIVDPSFDATVTVGLARKLGYRVTHVFNTHEHFDHVQDDAVARKLTGARVVAHRNADIDEKDASVEDGEIVRVGSLEVTALHSPGHTPGSTCWLVRDETGLGHVFTGDVLFVGNCGRCDLPGSDPAAMWNTLTNVLGHLPDDTVVHPGHDYGPTPTSTIGREKRENFTMAPRSREEFVRFVVSPD